MLIYNVTAHVEHSIEQSWLEWMEQEHIPEMLATKKFIKTKIFKINRVGQNGMRANYNINKTAAQLLSSLFITFHTLKPA